MVTIRSQEEIEKIRAAGKIVGRVIEKVAAAVRPGISTAELDQLAEKLILTEGGEPAFKGYRGYRHATCISVNSEVVHGIPSVRKLERGDIVGIDVGVRLDGFYGDRAMTVPVDAISREAKELLARTKEALYQAIGQARAGNHLGDVSATIEQLAKAHGYTVVRDLFGHGIGRELHEDPLIPNFGTPGEGMLLKPGMVLAIEPMFNVGRHEIVTKKDGWTVVTRDGTLSAHFEHTIAITEGEAEILTQD